ncbi:1,4-alpha-glucan branching protein GlgB [Gemmatimonadota bacterium]
MTESASGSTTFLTPEDIQRFKAGTHHRLFEILGSHPGEGADGERGVRFTLWAPNAKKVSIIGDFNSWDPLSHPLSRIRGSGVWQGWVSGAAPGDSYKYRLVVPKRRGGAFDKADPFARSGEEPPGTSSIIWESSHEWGDEGWMQDRAERNSLSSPIAIYEVHAGSWQRPDAGEREFLTYRELAPLLAEYVLEMGFTHVEFLPLMEHPFYGSWGYQTTGYFAPSSRYGTPDDLKYLIDHLHQAGIGVILDWVPSHFPEDAFSLGRFDGTPLYEHADPRRGYHPDWTSLIFDYGRSEVMSFLLSSAHYWLDHFHIDGLRVDAVASMLHLDYSRKAGEWVPNKHGGNENLEAVDFLRALNGSIYAEYPDVQTFAEESTAWAGVSHPVSDGGLGFGFKWDMGWMNDTLAFFATPPARRGKILDELTFRGFYAGSENFILPLSHDEVVYGKGSLLNKMPGTEAERFADLRLLLGYQYALHGKKLLFMGSEFAQRGEWSHDSPLHWELLDQSLHVGVREWVAAVNRLYRSEPALHRLDCGPGGFEWLVADDTERGVLALLRSGGEGVQPVVVVCNFSDREHEEYPVGVPHDGGWSELLNSDAARFGGGSADDSPVHEAASETTGHQPWTIRSTLPPQSIRFFR